MQCVSLGMRCLTCCSSISVTLPFVFLLSLSLLSGARVEIHATTYHKWSQVCFMDDHLLHRATEQVKWKFGPCSDSPKALWCQLPVGRASVAEPASLRFIAAPRKPSSCNTEDSGKINYTLRDDEFLFATAGVCSKSACDTGDWAWATSAAAHIHLL